MNSQRIDLINPQHLINSVSGNVFWKDKNHKLLGCNHNNAKLKTLFKINSLQDLFGKTIYEIWPHEYAENIAKNDEEVLQTGTEKIFEEPGLNSNNEPALFLSKKMPLYNADNTIVGLIGISFEITSHHSRLINFLLDNTNQLKKILVNAPAKRNTSLNRVYLTIANENIYLTPREVQCISCLFEGKTAKEIAKILNISPRTVEYYIAQLKLKLQCRTVTELVAKLWPMLKQL
jgi:DNA-binding CsgD family transcriptional regulator